MKLTGKASIEVKQALALQSLKILHSVVEAWLPESGNNF